MTAGSSSQDGAGGGPSGAAARLRTLAGQAAAALGLELVHLIYRREGSRWVLRIFVDREGGVTLDDCARASDQLGALLEVDDVITHSYTLEVSSPGLDRPLLAEQDYLRFTGRRARLKTHRPLEGRRTFAGTLAGFADGRVLLDLPEGPSVAIPLDLIASGRLEPDLDGTAGPPTSKEDATAKEKVKE